MGSTLYGSISWIHARDQLRLIRQLHRESYREPTIMDQDSNEAEKDLNMVPEYPT